MKKHLACNIASRLIFSSPGAFDLKSAADDYIHAFEKRTGICFLMRYQLKARSYNSRQAEVIFQIFQEILMNIERHTYATKVCISLGEHADLFILMIKYNSRGTTKDLTILPECLGLNGMRGYVRLYSGELRISGIPNKGTSIVVGLPVKQDADAGNKQHCPQYKTLSSSVVT
jgi:nitrate/nitrite-specific signal transduction histidine kinase